MTTSRLEAFSDAVLAIAITIMVLDLRPPAEPTWSGLFSTLPTFLSYVLSFVYLGIYWNNHHHMLQLAETVNGRILWANLHLLFWLSLIPFSTRWMNETGFVQVPVMLYGINLLLAAIAYFLLQRAFIAQQGADGPLAKALGRDWKGKLSPFIYVAGLALAFVLPALSLVSYTVVALIWLVPDRRLERYTRALDDS